MRLVCLAVSSKSSIKSLTNHQTTLSPSALASPGLAPSTGFLLSIHFILAFSRFQGSLVVGLQARQDQMCCIFPLQSWTAGQESQALGGTQNQGVGRSRALALELSTSSLPFCQPQRGVERGNLNKSQRYVAGEEERTGKREKGQNRRDTLGSVWRGRRVGTPPSSTLPHTFNVAPHLPVSNGLLLSCGALALCLVSSPQGQIHTSQQSPCGDHGLTDIVLVLSSLGSFQ